MYVHDSPDMVSMLMQVDLDSHIPPALYQAGAELLAWVYRLENEEPIRETGRMLRGWSQPLRAERTLHDRCIIELRGQRAVHAARFAARFAGKLERALQT